VAWRTNICLHVGPPKSCICETVNNLSIFFSRKLIMNENVTECSICLEELTNKSISSTLPCSHCFHTSCLNNMMKHHHCTSLKCPLCRADFSSSPNAVVHGRRRSAYQWKRRVDSCLESIAFRPPPVPSPTATTTTPTRTIMPVLLQQRSRQLHQQQYEYEDFLMTPLFQPDVSMVVEALSCGIMLDTSIFFR
jgi:hypothetical protein